MKIILLGAPGAGKGTQADIIASKYGIIKLSTGDLLRKQIADKTALGLQIKEIMDSGQLVSDEIMIELIKARTAENDCMNGFILDGFPRTINQADELDKVFDKLSSIGKTYVISLAVIEEELIKRISGRYTCKNCKTGYHKVYNKPMVEGVCDKCGSTEFTYREDDKEEAVKVRLETYRINTAPLIDYYKQKGKLYQVDGMQSIDKISQDIFSLLA